MVSSSYGEWFYCSWIVCESNSMSKPPDPNSSMEDMWRCATARFSECTGMSVNLKPPKTLNDCIEEINKSWFNELHGPTRKEKAEDYGINILRFLKLLGSVAAQGPEMVGCSPAI